MSTAGGNRRKGSQWPWYRETGKGAAGRGGARNLVGRAEAAVQKSGRGAAQCDRMEKTARAYPAPQRGESNGRMSGRREGTGELAEGRLGAAAQGNWQERDWRMRHGETNGRALESGGAGKLTERRREGPCRKIGKRGVRATARENRGKGTGRDGTEKATRTPPRGDGAGTPVSRRRGSETGQKSRAAKRAGGCPVRQPPAPLSISPVLMVLRRSPPAGRR